MKHVPMEYRVLIFTCLSWAVATPVSAAVRLWTGWQFMTALSYVMFATGSTLMLIVLLKGPSRRMGRYGVPIFACAVLLYDGALISDAVMRTPYLLLASTSALVGLGAAWLFWAWDLAHFMKGRSRANSRPTHIAGDASAEGLNK